MTSDIVASDSGPEVTGVPEARLPAEPSRWWRLAIVLVGILAGQSCLYGTALVGRQVLLPLDLLASRGVYLPRGAETAGIVPRDRTHSDQVLQYEMVRRFSAAEVRAGRWPLWSPYGYAGAPFFGVQATPFQSVYVLLWPSPYSLAWIQLLVAFVAGTGAYRYCRDVCGTAFWPTAIAAWCYPLTGFFVLWQGHALPHSAAFLPWLIWATDSTWRRPGGWGGPLLAVFTYCVLGGALDVAGQALLVSGAYALWQAGMAIRDGRTRDACVGLATVSAAWALGILLTFIGLLPFIEYAPTGARIQDRVTGVRERPPIGLSELGNVVLPELQGNPRPGSLFIGRAGNVAESSAAGYAGLFTACLLAPLAMYASPRRGQVVFWSCCAVAGLAWCLNIPGFVQFYNGPVLRNFSFNRFVFVTGWSIVALAAIGLDCLWLGQSRRSPWFVVPAAVVGLLAAFLLAGAVRPPEPIGSKLEHAVRQGRDVPGVDSLAAAATVRQGFQQAYLMAALTAAAASAGWLLLAWSRMVSRKIAIALAAAWCLELVRFAMPWPLLSDPALYYPSIATLERLAEAPAGRILGVRCLPPRLGERYGFRDIRGYDGVDPAAIVDLLACGRDPETSSPSYARTQFYLPRSMNGSDVEPRLPGVLNMLNVRYLLFRFRPPTISRFAFIGDDYWVWENPRFLPRAFVPRSVVSAPPRTELLARMSADDFDAAAVTFAEGGITYDACVGAAQVVREHPQEVVIEATMETPGLVVLADLWYPGWIAEIDGRPTTIHRVNHGLRGVKVAQGTSTIVMRYSPMSFHYGRVCSLIGVILLTGWMGGVFLRSPPRFSIKSL